LKLAEYIRSPRSIFGIWRYGNWLFFGALIGIIAGLGAILFTFGIQRCNDFFFGQLANYQIPQLGSEPVAASSPSGPVRQWLFFIIPAVGGLVVGWLVYTFAPEAEGHGTDAVINAFHRGRGIIRRRVPIIKTIASILTIGTGGSAGREGPVAQIGAGFGSFLADVLKLPDRERRLMVIAGMGGGIGSIFRAPLGGALFATEVLYREPEFEYEGLIPAIISAVVAYSVYGFVYGWGPIFATPQFLYHRPENLLLYLVFGVLAAGVGVLYVKVFYGMRDHVFRKLRIPKHFIPAIGGLLLGVLAYYFPEVMGSGYGWVQLAIYGKLAFGVMIVFPFLKIIATSLTISSGGSGGVFAPSLVIGGMLGGAFGEIARVLLPTWEVQPSAFIMVGMAGFFAGIAKVPISSLIMVAEMTGSYGLLVPTMFVAAVSYLVTGKVSIYERQVAHRVESPAHRGEYLVDILQDMKVRDHMKPKQTQQIVPEGLRLKDLIKRVTTTDHEYFFAVDNQKQLTGIVSLDDIRRVMLDAHLDSVIVVKDLAMPIHITLTPEHNLTYALGLFASASIDELPVTEGPSGALVGIIRKKDLIVAYNDELLKWKKVVAKGEGTRGTDEMPGKVRARQGAVKGEA
jgi:CIC family chloride channel protein